MTGMSGTGKSSALAELGRRGYRVVDTDDRGWREYRQHVESSDELHRGEWLWVEGKMTRLLDSDDGRSLDRVARRATNNYGKSPLERAMILDDLANVEPLLRASCTHEVDASRSLEEVVADLIARRHATSSSPCSSASRR